MHFNGRPRDQLYKLRKYSSLHLQWLKAKKLRQTEIKRVINTRGETAARSAFDRVEAIFHELDSRKIMELEWNRPGIFNYPFLNKHGLEFHKHFDAQFTRN